MERTIRERYGQLDLYDERLISIEVHSTSLGHLDTVVIMLNSARNATIPQSARALTFHMCTGVSVDIDLMSAAGFHNEIGETLCRAIANHSRGLVAPEEELNRADSKEDLTEFSIRLAEPAGSTIRVIARDFSLVESTS